MPSVKDFEKKNKKKKHGHKSESDHSAEHESMDATHDGAPKSEKRRPATEASHDLSASASHEEAVANESSHEAHEEAVYVPTEPSAVANKNEEHSREEDFAEAASESSSDFESSDSSEQKKHVHIEFVGSELLRSKVPKAFEVAEAVADDWVNDGSFEGLPVGHPLAQLAASVGLKKAKQVENKLREKGVFMMIQVGVEYAKSKLNKK